jgi:hypothetical protein
VPLPQKVHELETMSALFTSVDGLVVLGGIVGFVGFLLLVGMALKLGTSRK